MRRRGVLILVVLSLLFLFVLIAITYVLVATRQLSASKQFAKTGVTGDPPQVQLNKAMMQVLRGDAGIVDRHRHDPGKIPFPDRPAQLAGKHVRAVLDSGIDRSTAARRKSPAPTQPAGRSWNSRPMRDSDHRHAVVPTSRSPRCRAASSSKSSSKSTASSTAA